MKILISADTARCSGIVTRQETTPAGDIQAEARDWMAWDAIAALYLPRKEAHEGIRQAARRAVKNVPMMKPAAGCRLQVGGCRLQVEGCKLKVQGCGEGRGLGAPALPHLFCVFAPLRLCVSAFALDLLVSWDPITC